MGKKGFTDGGGKNINHKTFFVGGICSFHELETSHSKRIETLFGCLLVILCRRYSPDSSDAGAESLSVISIKAWVIHCYKTCTN